MSLNLNKVVLAGRLTSDPDLRTTPNGLSVSTFTVAVNRRYSKEETQTADFINVVAWRNTAEFISRYFSKGSAVCVCGSIQTRSWNGKDGKKRYTTEVLAETVDFVESKSSNTAAPEPQQLQQQPRDDFDYTPADDLPF